MLLGSVKIVNAPSPASPNAHSHTTAAFWRSHLTTSLLRFGQRLAVGQAEHVIDHDLLAGGDTIRDLDTALTALADRHGAHACDILVAHDHLVGTDERAPDRLRRHEQPRSLRDDDLA